MSSVNKCRCRFLVERKHITIAPAIISILLFACISFSRDDYFNNLRKHCAPVHWNWCNYAKYAVPPFSACIFHTLSLVRRANWISSNSISTMKRSLPAILNWLNILQQFFCSHRIFYVLSLFRIRVFSSWFFLFALICEKFIHFFSFLQPF